MTFDDRVDAGRQLAAALQGLGLQDPVVLALPRGGVPVAVEVARALRAPLDLLLVRKIGAPGEPELAVAAVAEAAEGAGPVLEIDEETRALTGASMDYVRSESARQLEEIERRRRLYLAGRRPIPLAGRTAVLVDDGIATGSTVRAALRALRARQPARIVLAVPVAPAEVAARLEGDVDELVCLSAPRFFGAVGSHYRDFAQVDDAEVVALLADDATRGRAEDGDAGPGRRP